jgi:hypothetical protein
MNATEWLNALRETAQKPAIPILSFPSVSLLGINVQELVSSEDLQAGGMKAISERVPSGAAVSMMDLSVEAEAFGSAVRFDPWMSRRNKHHRPQRSGSARAGSPARRRGAHGALYFRHR